MKKSLSLWQLILMEKISQIPLLPYRYHSYFQKQLYLTFGGQLLYETWHRHQLEVSLIAGQGIFVGYDIFFTNNGEHLKKFPLEKLNGLKLSDLVVAWRYPHLNDFAQALNGVETALYAGEV